MYMDHQMRQFRGKTKKEVLQKSGLSVAYEGELDGVKPHGKGKAYFKDGRIYEGDWVDGKYEGYGCLYYDNLNLWYEGEWKDGKRHGQGKSYYEDGTLAYDGEWKDGKPIK